LGPDHHRAPSWTTRSADVSLELGLAMALGKRLVVLAQCLEDIPTDLRGLVRPILYQPAGLGVATLMEQLKDQLRIVRAETVTENMLVPLKDTRTESMPGVIVLVEKERAVVEADGGHGQLLELGSADVDYARIIRAMTRRFAVDGRLTGAIVTDFEGARRYTLLANQSNPWPGIIADYPAGKIFTSRVVSMTESAKLPAVGARLLGIVTSAVPEQQGRGGFLLLRLKGYENGPRAILHCTQMSQELREDLNDSEVDLINEEIMVQVTQVDPSRKRIALLELPEADQEAAATAA
jgi:hypothetical protein